MVDTKPVTLNTYGFQNHMKRKADMWKPDLVEIGPDFAVFVFDTSLRVNNALEDALKYNNYYLYGIDVQINQKRFVIINPNLTEEI